MWLSSIPLYVCVCKICTTSSYLLVSYLLFYSSLSTLYLFISIFMDISLCTSIYLLISLWVLKVHVSFQISVFFFVCFFFLFFLDIYPGRELLGHMVVVLLGFKETIILFCTVAVPMYISTSSVGEFPFLYIVCNLCYLCHRYRNQTSSYHWRGEGKRDKIGLA